jgi:hypothetical protein
MSNRLRRFFAVACAALLLTTTLASSASSQTLAQGDAANAPAVVDVMMLRPAGFVSLVVGTGLFLALTPIVLITRPHEIGTPFRDLVVKPAKYLWVDPIGKH